MAYSAIIKRTAVKDFRRLPKNVENTILERIDGLKSNPFPHQVRKLVGAENLYRLRMGDYRIIYEVDTPKEIVNVIYVRHRKDAYESL